MRVKLTTDVAAFGSQGDTVDVSPTEGRALIASGQAEEATQPSKRKRARGTQTAETTEAQTEDSSGSSDVEQR